ncbi:tRNA uridine(34) 5-carboxymethylaminomethyl modification radical SAM/GNAT enzyme Elp3 [Patescibacteria group bacterium]|nr:tRNA uridine(34) 5-carboxymethylaminomethyl modification radical SAM/GNAT enzyme Elp3 [Patescibacteria group bacterium]
MEFIATPAQQFVLELSQRGQLDEKRLHKMKKAFAARFGRGAFANTELIEAYDQLISAGKLVEDRDLMKMIRKRGVRSHSGIANITVITKAFPCPGRCIFCPAEPKMPKSYLSNEPAIMRAILNDFSAYNQTINRLESLKKTGHYTDKVDVIISGGTWSFYPKKYQNDFVRGIFNALNYPAGASRSLAEAHKVNETAGNRCIGLSIETRPDHITEKELLRLRELGCTKIEIGVQSLNDGVLSLNKRGHGVAGTQRAIQLIRDAGYKINCHMMPNLYGSNPQMDYENFKELFENPAYRPDWLKIYPCVVVPWSQLQKIYEKGDYKPYSDEELIALMLKVKPLIPEYCRITRLIRDIPATSIVGGSKVSNLRQIIHARMEKEMIHCRCIRCRQVKGEKVFVDRVKMNVKEFDAAGGREFFISCDDEATDKLCALLRLRFSSYSLSGRPHFIKELEGAALVRELHTYGEQVRVAGEGAAVASAPIDGGPAQHVGLGKRMMQKAEDISRCAGYRKIAVISGIGVREYYRKLGYELEGTYMVKGL